MRRLETAWTRRDSCRYRTVATGVGADVGMLKTVRDVTGF